ncbi:MULTISPECIES: hypothetical protein, partial [Clostridia]
VIGSGFYQSLKRQPDYDTISYQFLSTFFDTFLSAFFDSFYNHPSTVPSYQAIASASLIQSVAGIYQRRML